MQIEEQGAGAPDSDDEGADPGAQRRKEEEEEDCIDDAQAFADVEVAEESLIPLTSGRLVQSS